MMHVFTERDAIVMEMQELKEQGRLDYDMYFELRKHRNQRYNELQDRLRTVDERDHDAKKREERAQILVPQPVPTPQPVLPKPSANLMRYADLTHEQRVLDRYRQEQTRKEEVPTPPIPKQEEQPKVRQRRHKSRGFTVPFEKVEEKVIQYLKHADGEEQMKGIKEYCESKLGVTWINFSEIMKKIMAVTPHIKTGSKRGLYLYDDTI